MENRIDYNILISHQNVNVPIQKAMLIVSPTNWDEYRFSRRYYTKLVTDKSLE